MKKKKRKQMIIIICIIIAVPIFYGIVNSGTKPSDEENYQSGMNYLNQRNYLEARKKLSEITPEFAKYSEVQSLLKSSDSLIDVNLKAKEAAEAKEKVETLRTSLSREIKSDIFTKGFGSNYRGSIEALQMELVVFAAWNVMIDDSDHNVDPEIKKLTKTLKNKVAALQRKEFPIMRKEYAKLLGQKLWEHNVEVQVKGTRNTILEFTGGMFAANKNIKDSQEALTEQLKMFRFKQTQYKWMEYADEYTYYDLTPPDDSALLSL